MQHQIKVSLARLEQVPSRDLQQSHIQQDSISVADPWLDVLAVLYVSPTSYISLIFPASLTHGNLGVCSSCLKVAKLTPMSGSKRSCWKHFCTAQAVPKSLLKPFYFFGSGWRWEEFSNPRCELSKVSLNYIALLPNKKYHCLHIVFICSSTLVLAPSPFSSEKAEKGHSGRLSNTNTAPAPLPAPSSRVSTTHFQQEKKVSWPVLTFSLLTLRLWSLGLFFFFFFSPFLFWYWPL